MLEHQAQVSHQLAELGETPSPKVFLLVLQSSVHSMYQLTIPERFIPKFAEKQPKPSCDEKIIRLISPYSYKLTSRVEGSAMVYLTSTVSHIQTGQHERSCQGIQSQTHGIEEVHQLPQV